eukprot:XP_017456563.1 PREDICTED: GRB2-associated and regulator of MAPK protein-like isoform X2 [Rattus norvegicus]
MDPSPSLGCSLKDVKWSPVAMPLDLLVSTYRLPQIARLDSAAVAAGRGANQNPCSAVNKDTFLTSWKPTDSNLGRKNYSIWES